MSGTYVPTQVILAWGPLVVSGYAEGTMITDTPVGDGVKAVVGTAGETAFIETPNRQRELVFRLMETSAVNAALASAYNLGNVPAPVLLSSLSTGSALVAGAGKLERIPGITYDNGMPVREWKLIVPKADHQILPVA